MKNKDEEYLQKLPWYVKLAELKDRCYNQASKMYPYYGKRGVRVIITADELRELYLRDEAYNMKKPSLHRIDNCGDYTKGNCRYIEFEHHIQLHKEAGYDK